MIRASKQEGPSLLAISRDKQQPQEATSKGDGKKKKDKKRKHSFDSIFSIGKYRFFRRARRSSL